MQLIEHDVVPGPSGPRIPPESFGVHEFARPFDTEGLETGRGIGDEATFGEPKAIQSAGAHVGRMNFVESVGVAVHANGRGPTLDNKVYMFFSRGPQPKGNPFRF